MQVSHIVAAAMIIGALIGFSSSREQPMPTYKDFVAGRSEVAQMQALFIGDPTPEEIRSKTEALLARHDMAPSHDNLDRLAGVLVRMRKDTGVPEMRIVDCMLELQQPSSHWELPAAAAFCSAGLAGKRRSAS